MQPSENGTDDNLMDFIIFEVASPATAAYDEVMAAITLSDLGPVMAAVLGPMLLAVCRSEVADWNQCSF